MTNKIIHSIYLIYYNKIHHYQNCLYNTHCSLIYAVNKHLLIWNVYKIIDCSGDQCYVSCRIRSYSTYYSVSFARKASRLITETIPC